MTIDFTTEKQFTCNSSGDKKFSFIPKALLFNLFSFFTETSLANFGTSCRSLANLQQDFLSFTRNRRFDAWQTIFQSKYTKIPMEESCHNFRIQQSSLSWWTIDGRIVFDLITGHQKVLDIHEVFVNGTRDERISVIDSHKSETERSFLFFDNKKNKILDQITVPQFESDIYGSQFPGPLSMLIYNFGTDSEDQSIYMVTRLGMMYLCNPAKIAEKELDAKEKCDKRISSICCYPQIFLEKKDILRPSLKQVSKVGHSYYFLWLVTIDNMKKSFISFSKNVKNISEHKILQLVDFECVSDNYFFYATYEYEIKIYRCGNVWKRIHLDNTMRYALRIFPTSEFLYVYQKNHKNHVCLSKWNHRKHTSEKELFTPIFKEEYDNMQISVEKDLLFRVKNGTCSVLHTSTNKNLATIDLSNKRILDVYLYDDPLPKNIFIDCSDNRELLHYSIHGGTLCQ